MVSKVWETKASETRFSGAQFFGPALALPSEGAGARGDSSECDGFRLVLFSSLLSLLVGLSLRKSGSLSSSRNLSPNNSKPIRISHEPGEKGVTKARKPTMTKTTPRAFLTYLLIQRNLIQTQETRLFVEMFAAS